MRALRRCVRKRGCSQRRRGASHLVEDVHLRCRGGTDPERLPLRHRVERPDQLAVAIEADPNAMMIAMDTQVRHFKMPGTGIPNFDHHAALIAKAGIYDLQVHHEQIVVPVVIRQWDAANITGLSGEGARAQERLMKRLATSERVAKRFAEKRAAALQPA